MEKISNYFYKAKSAVGTSRCASYLHRVNKLLTHHEQPATALLGLDFCACMAGCLADRAGDRTVKALVISILRMGFDSAVVIGPMPPKTRTSLMALRTSCIAENIIEGILLFLLDMVQQLKENNDSLVLLDQQIDELRNQPVLQDDSVPQFALDDSESQKEKEQDKEPAPTAELSDISIVIDQGTQQLGRTDLWDAVASDSASDSASPSLFENPPVQAEPLGLPDIASLQHKKFTEDRYSLLKERATLLDDIISVLFLLENILAIRTQPLAGASLQKGVSQKADTSRSLFNNFRNHEDDVFNTLLTLCIAGNLPQLLTILVNLVSTDVMAGLAAPLLRLLTVLLHNQSLYSISEDTTQPLAFRRMEPPAVVKSPKVKLNIVGNISVSPSSQERMPPSRPPSDVLSLEHPAITLAAEACVRTSRYASVRVVPLSPSTIASSQPQRGMNMELGNYYLLCRKNAPRRPLGNTFTRLKAIAGSETVIPGLSDDSSIISDIDSITSSDDEHPSVRGRSSSLTSAKTIPVHKIPVTWSYLSQPSIFTHFHRDILTTLCTDYQLLTFVTYCMDHISSICQIGLGMQQGFSRQLLYTKQHSVETDNQFNNAIFCCAFVLAAQSAAYIVFNTLQLTDTQKTERLGDDRILKYIESSTRVMNSIFGGLQRNSTALSGFNDHVNWYVRDTGLSCFYWINELIHRLGTAPVSSLGKRLALLSAEKNSASLMNALPPHAQRIALDALNKRLRSENEQLYRVIPVLQRVSRPLRMSISCLHTLSHMLETWAPQKGAELQCLCYYAQLLSTEDRLHSMLEALSLTAEQTFSVAAGFATKSVTGRVFTLEGSTNDTDDEPVAQFNLEMIGTGSVETELCTLGMFIARQISSSGFVSSLLIFIDSMFERCLFGEGQEEVHSLIFRILGLFTRADMKESGHTTAVFANLESILVLLTFSDRSSDIPSHQRLKELATQILDIVCEPAYLTDEYITGLFKRSKLPAHRSLLFGYEAKRLDNLLIDQHNAGSIYDLRARHSGVTYRRDLNALVINKDLVTDAALDEIIGDISAANLQFDDTQQKHLHQVPVLSPHKSEKDDLSFKTSMISNSTEEEAQSNIDFAQCDRYCDNGFTPETNQLVLDYAKRELKKGIALEDVMGALMIELECNFTVAQLIEQWKLLSLKSGRFSKEEDNMIIQYSKKSGGLGDVQLAQLATILHRKPQAIKKRVLVLQTNKEVRRHAKL